MKSVDELIEELQGLPKNLPVYHYDMKGQFSSPKVEIAESIIDGIPFKYVMITQDEPEPANTQVKESEITD